MNKADVGAPAGLSSVNAFQFQLSRCIGPELFEIDIIISERRKTLPQFAGPDVPVIIDYRRGLACGTWKAPCTSRSEILVLGSIMRKNGPDICDALHETPRGF